MLVKKDMDVNEHERLYVFRIPVDRLSIIQVKLTKISYIGTLFKVQSTEDSSLFMVWFRQVVYQGFQFIHGLVETGR